MSAPRLTTERLVLRPMRLDDFETFAAERADAVAMRHMSGVTDRRTSWRMFLCLSGQWDITGAGWWAIENEGAFVGTVGAFFRETQIGRGADAEIEVGWTVNRAHWKKGFATEAARAALRWAFESQTFARAVAYVDPPNTPSRRVCEKIGMTLEGETDFYGEPSVRYFVRRT